MSAMKEDEMHGPAVKSLRDRCDATIEGAKVPGTRSARMYRGTCRAYPMRDPGIEGYNPRRCFQHQSSEVRNEVYRRAAGAQS